MRYGEKETFKWSDRETIETHKVWTWVGMAQISDAPWCRLAATVAIYLVHLLFV